MATRTEEVKIKISANDQATAELKRLNKEFDKLGGKELLKTRKAVIKARKELKLLDDTVEDTTKQTDRMDDAFTDLATKIGGAAIAYKAFSAGKDILVDMISSASKTEAIMTSLTNIVAVRGDKMNDVLAEMEKHTGGLADRASVAEGFLKGMTTELSVDQISDMTQAIKDASIAMGEDFNVQLPLIIKAVKQLNPAILDNIGVTVRLDRINKKITEGYFGMNKEINEATQQNAIFQEIMRQTQKFQGQEAQFLQTSAGQWKQLQTNLSDISVTAGSVLLPTLNELLVPVVNFTKLLSGNEGSTVATWNDVLAKKALGDELRQLKEDFDGGKLSLEQFTEAMNQALGPTERIFDPVKAYREELESLNAQLADSTFGSEEWSNLNSEIQQLQSVTAPWIIQQEEAAFAAKLNADALAEEQKRIDELKNAMEALVASDPYSLMREQVQAFIQEVSDLNFELISEDDVEKQNEVADQLMQKLIADTEEVNRKFVEIVNLSNTLILESKEGLARDLEAIDQEALKRTDQVNKSEVLSEKQKVDLIVKINLSAEQKKVKAAEDAANKANAANRKIVASAGAAAAAAAKSFINLKGDLDDVWESMGAAFIDLFLDIILQALLPGSSFVTAFLGSFKFWDIKANDDALIREGSRAWMFIEKGINDAKRGFVPGINFDGLDPGGSLAPARGGDIHLHFEGPVTDEQFVDTVIIPKIEKAMLNNSTIIQQRPQTLTGNSEVRVR